MKKEAIALTSQYLAMRLESDEKFVERLKNDPAGVLKEAGLPNEVIEASTANIARSDDTYEWCCKDFTCWSSECPGTCYSSILTPTDWETGCVDRWNRRRGD